jgi:hypothetical protein
MLQKESRPGCVFSPTEKKSNMKLKDIQLAEWTGNFKVVGEIGENVIWIAHKPYIVALDKIAEIDNNVLILKSKVQLPISSNYKDVFLAKMRG